MKVLFTCVGRRVEMVQIFKTVFEDVYGSDLSSTAPALQFCDKTFLVPPIYSDDYIPALEEICRREQIDVLIPTIDTDLLLLSENRHVFERQHTKVLISAPEMISVCRDKRKTQKFFTSLGLYAPPVVDDYRQYMLGYPAFIKPRDGSSSVFAYKVESFEELERFAQYVPQYIIQPFIEGEEYTVDIMCDFQGHPIYVTPRKRLEVRSGEVLKTQIWQEDSILQDMGTLIEKFKPCGPLTVQLIRDRKSGKNCYIEINPRFGGGAPLSMMAGAASAQALKKILEGELLEYQVEAAEHGAIFSRFDQSVRIL